MGFVYAVEGVRSPEGDKLACRKINETRRSETLMTVPEMTVPDVFPGFGFWAIGSERPTVW